VQDIARGDIVLATMLFMEDHYLPVFEALKAKRDHCDAMVCAMSAGDVVKLTKIGKLDMSKLASGPMAIVKKTAPQTQDRWRETNQFGRKTNEGVATHSTNLAMDSGNGAGCAGVLLNFAILVRRFRRKFI